MKIPLINLDELKSWINILENLDLTIMGLTDVIPYVNRIFNLYAIACPVFSPPNKIYRAVKWSKRPTNIKQLIHPKPECITSIGRCNDIGVSYFYGSFNWEPTLFELRVKEGDFIVLSLFNAIDHLEFAPIGFTNEVFQRLFSNRVPPPEARPNNVELIERDSNKIVDKYIAESFTKIVNVGEEYKYKISVAISKFIMSNEHIDGIIYPSILMKADSENIALKSESVFHKLQLINTVYAKVGRNNGLFHEIFPEFISNRFALNGDLFWAKVKNHKIENGKTVFEAIY
jgi:hypothetical protein